MIIFCGVAVGVSIRTFYAVGIYAMMAILLVALVVAIYRALAHTPVQILAASIFCIAVVLGMLRMHVAIPEHVALDRVGAQVTLEGRVVAEPDVRDGYTNLTIATDAVAHKVLTRVRSQQTFHYADTVRVKGTLEQPENFVGDTGRTFNYQGYLAKDDVYYIITTRHVDVLSSAHTFRGVLLAAKQSYLAVLKSYLSEPYAALAGGITVGERRSLGDALTQKFRDAGLIHIVVLSGYNISIIIIALMYILSFLPKRVGAIISIGAIIIFTLIVGASATVVRAALMGTIGALGIFFRRSYNALHALFIAGLVMVLWNPYVVVYDPSFQLSFMATLGLLLGAPLLMDRLRFIPRAWGTRELVAVTLATQIAVLPLLVYMMGTVSLVALPVNVLSLPAIPLAMLLVFVVGVLGSVVPFVASIIAFGAEALLSYVVHVVTLATALPFATLTAPSVSFVWVVAGYTFLIVAWWYSSTYARKD